MPKISSRIFVAVTTPAMYSVQKVCVCGGGVHWPPFAAVGSYTVITNMIIEEKGEKLDCWLFGEHAPTKQQTWFHTC